MEITHEFIYKNGEYRKLDTPFGQQAEARGINNAGLIVGDTYDDPFESPVHGFLLDKKVSHSSIVPKQSSMPFTVNSSGMLGGLITARNLISGELERSAYVRIYFYPYEVFANVFGLNDQGQIVGNYFDPDLGRTVGYVATLPSTPQPPTE